MGPLEQSVKNCIEEIHSELFGFCELSSLKTLPYYKKWIEEGLHGEMEYLKRQIVFKEDPKKLLPNVHSAIMFLFPYFPQKETVEAGNSKIQSPESKSLNKNPFPHLRVSLYAQEEDYHFWVKRKLEEILKKLKKSFPEEDFLSFTDSSPILERELAYQSGLGWFGKNACLIHPKKGSLFFLGGLYSSLKLKSTLPQIHNFCGQCTKCMDLCPTSAIVESHKIDAKKCISYLNIELKKVPHENLRSQMKDWFFGCDICQTVCPWNEHSHEKNLMATYSRPYYNVTDELVNELRWILESSHTAIEKKIKGSALSRARGFGLKRNAIIVATNLNLFVLAPWIESLLKNEKYKELALWSLKNLKKSKA